MDVEVYTIQFVRYNIETGVKEDLHIEGLDDALEMVEILRRNNYKIISLKLVRGNK